MSRAEMFLAWLVELISEIVWYIGETTSFIFYYIDAGGDLWGDNKLMSIAGAAFIGWLYMFRQVWVDSEFTQANLYDAEWTEKCAEEGRDPSVTSTYDRFMKSLFWGAYLGFGVGIAGWIVLSFLLGFFFGPIR